MARAGLFTKKLSALFYQKPGSPKLTCICQFASVSRRNLDSAKEETGSESESDSDGSKPDDFVHLKLQILEAGLKFVPKYGWSKKSLALGADSIGLSLASHSLIQDGGADLVHYLNFSSNEKLKNYLSNHYSSQEKRVNIQDYVEDALDNRLRMIIPYASKWSEAMALMISPIQLPTNSKNLLNLMNIVWLYSGDKSLDFSWYGKRMALGTVYRMCELSLCQDKSPEYTDTFEFLQRLVENVIQTNDLINQVAEGNKHLPEFTTGALITFRNMLGVNRWFR